MLSELYNNHSEYSIKWSGYEDARGVDIDELQPEPRQRELTFLYISMIVLVYLPSSNLYRKPSLKVL